MISCRELRFSYTGSPFELSIPELKIERGTQLVMVGPSGSGKTTFLNLLAGILQPDSGSISIDGIELTQYDKPSRQDFRIVKIGLVFQEFALLEYLNVLENIILPYRLNPVMQLADPVRARGKKLASMVGLGDKLKRFPRNLSQGEKQRVAFCRALVTEPEVLLCDEPTANLDPGNRDHILDLLLSFCRENGKTLVMVTHDHEILDRFDEVIDIRKLIV